MRGITIQAESSFRDLARNTLELKGHVYARFSGQEVRAQEALIHFTSKTIDARGDVSILDGTSEVFGSRVLFDFDSGSALIYDGFVRSGNMFLESQVIYRASPTEYLAEQGRFTTCTVCPEPWRFSGSYLRAELGGYAYMKNVVLRTTGVPIFWLPYLVVPLKSDRQSGLLTPNFEYSKAGGATVEQSFFWAISPSSDATYTLRYHELRGIHNIINYRYKLTEHSEGEVDFSSISDKVFPSSERLKEIYDTNTRSDRIERWYLKYLHRYDLPHGFVSRASLNATSDLQYPRDFPYLTKNHGDSALENRISISKSGERDLVYADSSYYINLLKANPLEVKTDAVHRLPELSYRRTPTRIGESDFLYRWDLNYTQFYREGQPFDDISKPFYANHRRFVVGTGATAACSESNWYNDPGCQASADGHFDPERDLLRAGSRLQSIFGVSYPFQVGQYLDIVPDVSFAESRYQFPFPTKPQTQRSFARSSVKVRSTASRVYDLSDDPTQIYRGKHEIQPEITFTNVPWYYRPSHPFFGPEETPEYSYQQSLSDADLNNPGGIQFDFFDRVYSPNFITFAFIQKWITNWRNTYSERIYWRLYQSYDFYQAERGGSNSRPLSDLGSELRILFNQVSFTQTLLYSPYTNVSNSSNRLRYTLKNQDYYEIGYSLSHRNAAGQAVDYENRSEEINFTVRQDLKWADLAGRLNFDQNPPPGRPALKSYAYGVQLRFPGDCLYLSLFEYQITGGDPVYKVMLDFIWDGNTRPRLPSTGLTEFGF